MKVILECEPSYSPIVMEVLLYLQSNVTYNKRKDTFSNIKNTFDSYRNFLISS